MHSDAVQLYSHGKSTRDDGSALSGEGFEDSGRVFHDQAVTVGDRLEARTEGFTGNYLYGVENFYLFIIVLICGY
jgi:hypothetical protein